MARDIDEWLEDLGLGRYADTFAENEIDLDALLHVTEEDLKEIGIALGARRKQSRSLNPKSNRDQSRRLIVIASLVQKPNAAS